MTESVSAKAWDVNRTKNTVRFFTLPEAERELVLAVIRASGIDPDHCYRAEIEVTGEGPVLTVYRYDTGEDGRIIPAPDDPRSVALLPPRAVLARGPWREALEQGAT